MTLTKTIVERAAGDMIHFKFSCDFRGCDVEMPSVATHAAVMPGDWGTFSFMARSEDKHECHAEGHLCPEHAEEVGKLFGHSWDVSTKMMDEPPKRFR